MKKLTRYVAVLNEIGPDEYVVVSLVVVRGGRVNLHPKTKLFRKK